MFRCANTTERATIVGGTAPDRVIGTRSIEPVGMGRTTQFRLCVADGETVDRLDATVQPYAWGDRSFIADLQGRVPSGEPEAELWMGAHPKAPSRLAVDGRTLDAVIAAEPEMTLGADVAERFGRLPFLAKVLSAAEPLSIQAHPSLEQARAGWARENDAGVALDDPQRTYRDNNHKPEVICALTPFEAKCGFRSLDATRELFAVLDDPALDEVRDHLAAGGAEADVLASTLAWLLRLPADQASTIAKATVRASATAPLTPWTAALAWSAEIDAIHPGDIGVTVALLLNHVTLEPGQAVFLGAGNLHAYLRGSGIELMANSDNVVRGGLTPKHVDVEELISVVDCSPIVPPVQDGAVPSHTYDTPVPEFSLTRTVVDGTHEVDVDGPEIVIATEGTLDMSAADGTRVIAARGEPVWVAATDERYAIRGRAVVFRATVGTG